MEKINQYFIGAIVPILLIASGIFFGIYTRLWSPKGICAAFKSIFGSDSSNARKKGEISPKKALAVALAGTLGVGNIVGVSAAIWWGGAGAVFWMWLSAIVAASLKYAEIFLGVKERKNKNGRYFGGAPIYIEKAFTEKKHPKLGIFLSKLFSALCLLDAISMGCIIQVNAVSCALEGTLGIDRRICGALMAVAAFIIASGGLSRISSACNAVVPFMTVGFCLLSVSALVIRSNELVRVIGDIFCDAFSFIGLSRLRGESNISAIFGGIAGFFMSRGVRYGVMRGLLSNEAGCGTSPLAHSSANTESAVKQGFFGIAEVFVDTVFLCTVTALVILSNYDTAAIFGENSVMMTISAYSAALGNWSIYPLAVAVLLFGLATVICWAYYGLESLHSLVTDGKKFSKIKWIFISIYSLSAYIGAVSPPGEVWGLADLAIGAMTVINITVLFLKRKEIRDETIKGLSR